MGTIVSKAVSGIGSLLGSAFVVPIKIIFGNSCEGSCLGTWDLICFIEHLCISSLLRLFIVSVLSYIVLLFFYLMFKVGILQCIGRGFCKMAWAACEAYWTALEEISLAVWHKIKNTKRVYRRRRRFEDMEEEFESSDYEDENDASSEDYESVRVTNGRKRSVRDRRRERLRQSLHPRSNGSKRSNGSGRHHHVRLKTKEVSVHVRGSRRSRAGQSRLRGREPRMGSKIFERRRR